MTDNIPLTQLGNNNDVRRDQWGRYLIVPPNETTPVGYTRVTTIAKTLDSGGGLAPWKASMTAAGIIMRRGLRAQWEALMAQHGGDPWYAGEQSKAACKKLVEECAAVGGANDRREIGTALHAITAIADYAKIDPPHLTEETAAELRAYRTGLALAGIDIDYDNVELTVVLDDWRVAGTFDRLVHVPGFDLPLIADLKTGADLTYSGQSIAVQLAAYAHADDIYVQGTHKDGSQDVRTPFPAVDQRWGLVMWLPAGDAQLELFIVDLEAGWAAFDASVWCRGWRNRKDLMTPLSEFNVDLPHDDLEAQLERSLAAVGITTERVAAPGEGGYAEAVEEAQAAVIHEGSKASVRAWLQARIEVIGKHPQARAQLGTLWPHDLPSLLKSQEHTTEQLVVIEAILDDVERANDLAFAPNKPGNVTDLFPTTN